MLRGLIKVNILRRKLYQLIQLYYSIHLCAFDKSPSFNKLSQQGIINTEARSANFILGIITSKMLCCSVLKIKKMDYDTKDEI